MTNSIYNYVRRIETISGSKAPNSSHLVAENSDQSAIFFPDSDDVTILLKLVIATNTLSQVVDRTFATHAIWKNLNAFYGMEDDGNVYSCNMANNGITEYGTQSEVGWDNAVGDDVFMIGGTIYALYSLRETGADDKVMICHWDSGTTWHYEDDIIVSSFPEQIQLITFVVVAGTKAYFAVKNYGDTEPPVTYTTMFKFDSVAHTLTELNHIDNYYIPLDSNYFGMVYDEDDTISLVLRVLAGNYYLVTYTISTDTFSVIQEYKVSLMLDRFTNISNKPECLALEKGFRTDVGNKLKIYQRDRKKKTLNYLGSFYSTYPADTFPSAEIIAITDYFLIIYDGTKYDLWKFEDVMGTCIAECLIDSEERTWTSIDLIWLNQGAGYQDPPCRDQFIQVFGRYSSYTLGAPYYGDNLLIAEGLVRTFNLDIEQEVRVESLAQEELAFAPNITSYTNYTGKTSGEVITQLITDYCKTITAGTIVNGSITWTCPADWSVAGDKSLEVILNELADSENFSWRLRPNCKLDFDAGNVDSQMNFASTDSYGEQEARLLSQQINQIIVYGGFVSGSQVGPYYANDTNHQQLYGNIVKWSKTYSGIFDATFLQTIANNKLLIQGAKPLVYWCERYCTDWGFIQVGETVDIGAGVKVAPNSTQTLTAGAYIVNRNKFDAKNNTSELKISDGMLFLEDGSDTLSEQNSELIQQIAGSIAGFMSDLVDDLSPQLGGDLDLNGKSIDFPTTPNISDCLDEDNMASNSATKLATQQSIKAYVDAVTTAMNVNLAIGSGNARWIACPYEGSYVQTRTWINMGSGGSGFSNAGADDTTIFFNIPLPMKIGTLNLYIAAIRISVFDADGTDYVDGIYLHGVINSGAPANIWSNSTNLDAPATTTTYNGVGFPFNVGGTYNRVYVSLVQVCTTALDLDISNVEVQYYYA